MNTITLKDVPAAVHKALKQRARTNGRSLNKEIITTLEAALHSSRIDTVALRERALEVRESMGIYLTQRELDAFKNAGRT